MPQGFHVYRRDRFDLAVQRSYRADDIEVSRRESVEGFEGSHRVTYWVQQDDAIRVDDEIRSDYQRPQPGSIWLQPNYVLIRMPAPLLLRFMEHLEAPPQVGLTRLCLPGLKAVHQRLGSAVTGRALQNPTNRHRRRTRAYGEDMDDDEVNRREVAAGELEMVQWRDSGSAVELFDTGSIVIFGGYDDDLSAAQRAWALWRAHAQALARPWRRNWRKIYLAGPEG